MYATLAFCCQVIKVHEIVRQVLTLTVLAIFTLTLYNYMYMQYELCVATYYTVLHWAIRPSVIYMRCNNIMTQVMFISYCAFYMKADSCPHVHVSTYSLQNSFNSLL